MGIDLQRFLRAPADEGAGGAGEAGAADGGAGGAAKAADGDGGGAAAAGTGGSPPSGRAAGAAAGEARAVPDWAKSLDADTQAFVTDKGWTEPGAAMQSYRELESLMGDKRLVPPPANATDEQWSGWGGWKNLGRPDSPDGYKLDDVIPEANHPAAFDATALENFKAIAHAEGVPARTLRKLVGAYKDFAQGTIENYNKRTKNAQVALQREWGAEYQANVDGSITTFNAWRDQIFGADNHEAKQSLDEAMIASGLGSNPYFVQMLHSLGDTILEEGQLHGVVNGTRMSATTAQARLQKLNADPDAKKAALDSNHPNHAAVMGERLRLNQIIKGEKPNA